MTQTIENTTNTTGETSENAQPAERRYVAITLTDALRDAIETRATAENTTPGLLCRSIVAQFLGVTIDVDRAAPRKYATEAERKAAQKAQRADRNALIKQLLAAHKAAQAAGTPAPETAETPGDVLDDATDA